MFCYFGLFKVLPTGVKPSRRVIGFCVSGMLLSSGAEAGRKGSVFHDGNNRGAYL